MLSEAKFCNEIKSVKKLWLSSYGLVKSDPVNRLAIFTIRSSTKKQDLSDF